MGGRGKQKIENVRGPGAWLSESGSGEARWLKAADVSGECLAVWEAGEAARVDKRDYERNKDSRKQKRDAEAATEVQTFRDSKQGKIDAPLAGDQFAF